MQQNIIKELLTRVSSASPTLFKRLQAIFFTLAGVVTILIFLAPLHINLHGLEVYVNWNTVIALLTGAGLNMLPVADPTVLQKKTNDEGDGSGGGVVGGSDPADKPKPDKP